MQGDLDCSYRQAMAETQEKLRLIFEGGVKDLRVAVLFSGGKDSMALLDLCRPYRDKLSLVWIDTGYAFPHIEEHVRKNAQGFELRVIKHDPVSRWFRDGLPSSIIPIDHWKGATSTPLAPRVQPWKVCCAGRIDDNLDLLASYGFNVLLSGQREDDAIGNFESQTLSGLMIYAPLWRWPEADVLAYLKDHSLELAQHADGCDTSMECMICPAQMTKNRAALIKANYPHLWEQVSALVNETLKAVDGEASAIKEALR